MLKSRRVKYLIGREVAKNPNYYIFIYTGSSFAFLCFVLVHVSWILALILIPIAFIGLCALTIYIDKYTTRAEKEREEWEDIIRGIRNHFFWKRFFGG